MGELSLDNILDGEDLDLFGGVEVTDPNENGNTENPNDEELFGTMEMALLRVKKKRLMKKIFLETQRA